LRISAARQFKRKASCHAIAGEIVAEIDGSLSDTQADELARCHGLVRLQSQNFQLIGATIGLFRITGRRTVETASRQFAGDAARRMGSAPAARMLAIRAFAVAPNGGESTSFVILKALDYAAAHRAQIVNMSFAGPNDALVERGISAAATKGIVMVAAAGNTGAKSPPLYPAAYRSVIAVSATDAQDKLFAASNRGGHIAISAPDVDIFLPAPDEKYQIASGTSFSAAYVSGLAALLLERDPALKPDEVRAILMKTARDLGAPRRDDLFGAGEANADAAVSAVAPAPATPVATVSDRPAEDVPDRLDAPATRALDQPPAAIPSDNRPLAKPIGPPRSSFPSKIPRQKS
jgi:subtilisin family serine protease